MAVLQSTGVALYREGCTEGLHEVMVVEAAVGARPHTTVLTEEAQFLVRRDHRELASRAPEPVYAARSGCEDVVGIHGAEYELGSAPPSRAAQAAQL